MYLQIYDMDCQVFESANQTETNLVVHHQFKNASLIKPNEYSNYYVNDK